MQADESRWRASNARLLAVLEAWRVSLGMTHTAFAAWCGREKTEWAHARAGRRRIPREMVRALRRRAQEVGGVWPSRIDVAIQGDALDEAA